MPQGKLPSAPRLITRLILVSALVLTLAYAARLTLVRPLLPAIRASVSLLDDDFQILSVDTVQQQPNAILSIRANLRHPVSVGSIIVYPLGTHGRGQGWYQVTFLVAGVFEYCLLLIILTFAWPAAARLEYLRRAVIAAPLLVLILCIDIPFTTMAELRSLMHQEYEPYAFWPLLAWTRFWTGGGGFLIATLMAVATIRLASGSSRPARQ
jgi:hypothetical protein